MAVGTPRLSSETIAASFVSLSRGITPGPPVRQRMVHSRSATLRRRYATHPVQWPLSAFVAPRPQPLPSMGVPVVLHRVAWPRPSACTGRWPTPRSFACTLRHTRNALGAVRRAAPNMLPLRCAWVRLVRRRRGKATRRRTRHGNETGLAGAMARATRWRGCTRVTPRLAGPCVFGLTRVVEDLPPGARAADAWLPSSPAVASVRRCPRR
jgi:hypothetical protein